MKSSENDIFLGNAFERIEKPILEIRPQPDKTKQMFSITFLKTNCEAVKHFTGFESFEHFMYLFYGLGPAAQDLTYKNNELIPEDQLFLTLIKLRQAMGYFNLGHVFGISRKSAARVFINWLNFLYFQLKEIDIWVSRKVIDETMPKDFKLKFPNTRVILDATEVPIQKP